jgi:hypothetical protein
VQGRVDAVAQPVGQLPGDAWIGRAQQPDVVVDGWHGVSFIGRMGRSCGYSTGVFHLRVMFRHARPHRVGAA